MMAQSESEPLMAPSPVILGRGTQSVEPGNP